MESNILAGTWRTNITPPLGVGSAGSPFEVRMEEILDDLYSNAIIIDDGGKEVAIISIDVCNVPDDVYRSIAIDIEKKCNILQANIIIAATHTHNGPYLGGSFVGIGDVDGSYVENFKKCVVTSAVMAQKMKKPAAIGVGRGFNDKFIFNRRLKRPNGSIIMNWVEKEFLQDCVETGKGDTEVIFITLEGLDNKPFAFIVNYSNHNNAKAGGPFISADYAGYLAKLLSKIFGEDAVTLFLPGACGDINWVNFKDIDQGVGMKVVKQIGTSLAGTILENMGGREYPENTRLKTAHKRLMISDRPFCDYDTQRDDTFGLDDASNEVFLSMYRRERALEQRKELPNNEVNIHAVSLCDEIAIVTNPGELFVEFGFRIKENSPFKYTLVAELVNGCAGYICTKRAFTEGGYEVRKSVYSSHLCEDAGDEIVEASIELLKKIKSE